MFSSKLHQFWLNSHKSWVTAIKIGISFLRKKFFFGELDMNYVLIIHEVEDYEIWKKIFDKAASLRKAAGEQSFQVLKLDDDPNKIVHFSNWTSLADAKAFFQSPKLVQIRQEAGVKAPEFIYLEQLEHGHL